MKVEKIARVFKFEGKELADPNPNFTIGEVIDFYSNEYPKMINSTYESTNEDGMIVIEIKTSVGTKG